MQKMSFRQVRDIQEAVRLLSKGVFINAAMLWYLCSSSYVMAAMPGQLFYGSYDRAATIGQLQ